MTMRSVMSTVLSWRSCSIPFSWVALFILFCSQLCSLDPIQTGFGLTVYS
jgi:hypothetical protein